MKFVPEICQCSLRPPAARGSNYTCEQLRFSPLAGKLLFIQEELYECLYECYKAWSWLSYGSCLTFLAVFQCRFRGLDIEKGDGLCKMNVLCLFNHFCKHKYVLQGVCFKKYGFLIGGTFNCAIKIKEHKYILTGNLLKTVFMGSLLIVLPSSFHLELFEAPVFSRAELLHYAGPWHPNPHPILTFRKLDRGQGRRVFPTDHSDSQQCSQLKCTHVTFLGFSPLIRQFKALM